MGSLRFADIQTRPTEVLDLTNLTVDEFRRLVPPFEAVFQAHIAEWRLDGQLRTARRYTTYKNRLLATAVVFNFDKLAARGEGSAGGERHHDLLMERMSLVVVPQPLN